MATTLKGFGRAENSSKSMNHYKSVIQLSDVPLGKYDRRRLLQGAEPSSNDVKGGQTLVLAVPLGIIILMAIALGFRGAVSLGAYALLIGLSGILIAILVYVAVTLLGDGD
jgi:hypothetical protein